ncbi:hypothetical protein WA026_011342 [Henosepilachna vigintioctopunctata]|uniref:Uncharacterized protein n=1 Tax=Henosepilachna vigintioctopunctata TaxID=420089 RepID=A0AAW1TJF1_9CUCU
MPETSYCIHYSSGVCCTVDCVFETPEQVNESSSKHQADPNAISSDSRRQPVITFSTLEHEIDTSTFQGGRAKVECVASVFNLYRRPVEKVLEEERPRPRPSSVLGTRDSASGYKASNAKIYITLLMLSIIIRQR